ncbi:MAG: serine hydrolase [Pseudomonadota bacterium]
MIRMLTFAVTLILLCAVGAVQADTEFETRATQMLSSIFHDDAPGAAVVVSRNGEVIYSRAFGMANIGLDVPVATDHVFRLASVTKQYAAAGLLALIEDGEVALDDPLSKFLPDFPIGEVTIEQLLNHTSGIKSYTGIPGYMMSERIRADLSTNQLVAVFADEAADFAPGEAFAYNNSGYVLVGAVIEAVTGQPWNDFIRERLLLPLGIEQTDAYADNAVVPGRVQGYAGPVNAPVRARYLSMTQPHAAGALMATAADVDRWSHALHTGRVIGDELYQAMITPTGAAIEALGGQGYGYGLIVGDWYGQPAYHHGGGIFGFSTHTLWLPDEQLSVVVLTNSAGGGWSRDDVSLRLAGLATGRTYSVDLEPVDMDADALAQFVGTYRIDEDTVRTLRLEHGQLISQRQGSQDFTVYAVQGDRLAFENSLASYAVERDAGGAVVAVALQDGWGAEPERAIKISNEIQVRETVQVAEAELQRLVGDYELQPGMVLTVSVNDGQLQVQATGQGPLIMQAESSTRFFNTQIGAEIEFDATDDGPASSLTLFQGGVEMPAPRVTADAVVEG